MDPYANINAEYFVAVHMQITTGKALSRFPVYDTQAIQKSVVYQKVC